jgi:hypothetical protein
MRFLRKPVPEYHEYLMSPGNPRNKPRGKRTIDGSIFNQFNDYAGLRTKTPGVIPACEPWGFCVSRNSVPHSDVSVSSPRFLFSSAYRPQIRVNISNGPLEPSSKHRTRRGFHKTGLMETALCGSVVSSRISDPPVRKHCTYSLKRESDEFLDRRSRKDHPEISPRMRRGADIGHVIKSQFNMFEDSLPMETAPCCR